MSIGKFKYIGKDYWFIKNGDIIEANPTTWSVKKPNTSDRTEFKCIYFQGVGFKGESISVNLDKFIKITYGGNK